MPKKEASPLKRRALGGALLALCLMISLSAFASGSAPAADGSNAEFEDSAATENATPSIPLEEALLIARYSLNADDAWAVIRAELNADNGCLVYDIVLTDPSGTEYERLVDAQTGEATAGTPGEQDEQGGDNKQKKDDGDNDGDDGDHKDKDKAKDDHNDADDQSGAQQDGENTDAAGEPTDDQPQADDQTAAAPALTVSADQTTAAPALTVSADTLPLSSAGAALDALADALGAKDEQTFLTGTAFITGDGLMFPVTAISPDGVKTLYLVNAETGVVTLGGE